MEREEGIMLSTSISINMLGYADDVDVTAGEELQQTEEMTTTFRRTGRRVGLEVNQDETNIMETSRQP